MTHARFGTASALTEDGNLWLVGGLGPNWMFDGFTTEIIGEHYNGSAAVQWSIQSEFGLYSRVAWGKLNSEPAFSRRGETREQLRSSATGKLSEPLRDKSE